MKTSATAAALLISLALVLVNTVTSAHARIVEPDERLTKGEVVVGHHKEGKVEYVVGRIRIHQPVSKVWPVLTNPFEFEEHISPKFHTVEVIKDAPDLSVMRCRVDIGFLLPPVHYVVESRYDAGRKISFHSLGGDLRDFRGYWGVEPAANGKECDVVYSMFCEPGIPIPQFIVRQGIKIELPHTLIGLRERVDAIYTRHERPVTRAIAASGCRIARL